MILPEDKMRPAVAFGMPEEPVGSSSTPAPAPSHDGTLGQIAELAAMKEKLEALQLDYEKLQHKVSDKAHHSERKLRSSRVLWMAALQPSLCC